jgi:hypothetical protein
MMNRSLKVFLQIGVVLIGVCVLGLMIWEPQIEGRNQHATLFQIYFEDPFLAYAYVASVPFFVALYQAFKVLGYAGKNQASVSASLKALRTIRNCATALIIFVAGGLIFITLSDSDDRAGGVFMGFIIALGSLGMAVAAAKFERIMRDAASTDGIYPR